MADSAAGGSATKCPVCGTIYGSGLRTLTDLSQITLEECGGEGNCPAREAGPRPTRGHVLCACNRRWLVSCGDSAEGHGFDDCSTDAGGNQHVSGTADSLPGDGSIQEDKWYQGDVVTSPYADLCRVVDKLFDVLEEIPTDSKLFQTPEADNYLEAKRMVRELFSELQEEL